MSFRRTPPARRLHIANKSDYREYFLELKEDFKLRCGYCGSFDKRRNNDFEIDHFVPQRVLNEIKTNEYKNLVYSCKSCNRSKSGKWISDDENISIVNEEGFIDPCNEEYDTHFIRHTDGDINWTSNIGKWIYRELSLFNIQHTIFWLLEDIRNSIDECRNIMRSEGETQELKDCLLALYIIEEEFLNKIFK
ncbi:HNH endonuclease [Flavobacterium sp. DG2-3]|uniref:HNH endonuclease n=1 Tax=Flavobacterium sp. DG2-3 TaxID=3068317 RepID=UPI00274026CF|nr:HNH endonuclease signature motif containing protein [Flavobacterium sp. DG2-3]MDP5202354.1 HNH endonuclease signature motif containing protein [Flavobacterium sp. DG2-3]